MNVTRHQATLEGTRMSMPKALTYLGVDWPDIYHQTEIPAPRGCLQRRSLPFWVRNEDRLQELAYESRKAFRHKAKRVRPDFTENHEEAVRLNACYAFIRRMLAARGVIL